MHVMTGPRPMLGNFNDPDITAGDTPGRLPCNAVYDQEDSYGTGLSVALVL